MIKKYAFLAFVVVILLNFAVDSKCFLGPYRNGKRGSIAKGKVCECSFFFISDLRLKDLGDGRHSIYSFFLLLQHETITSVRDTIDATEDRGINRETRVPLRFFQVQKGGE